MLVTALSLRLVAFASFLLAPAAALALTFSTSDSQFDPGVDNQGWWSNGFANHDHNDNYFVGSLFGAVHGNFFTFDLTALPAATNVVSATLRLTRFTNSLDNEAVEALELFDVSTDPATLNENNGMNAAILSDLGSGTSYGAFDVPGGGVSTNVLEFVLNGGALADIESAAGGFFSVGGVLTSDNGND